MESRNQSKRTRSRSARTDPSAPRRLKLQSSARVLIEQKTLEQVKQFTRSQEAVITRMLELLTMEPAVDKFLAQILEVIAEQLGGHFCTLYLYDEHLNVIRRRLEHAS